MIIINFSFDTKYGQFSDALCLPDDHQFSTEELESMKQQRLNNWISIIDTPPAIDETPISMSLQE